MRPVIIPVRIARPIAMASPRRAHCQGGERVGGGRLQAIRSDWFGGAMETQPAASTCHRIASRTINSGNHYLAKVERLHRVSRERFREKAWWGVVRTIMSSSEFDALQSRLYRLAPETIAIARAVLVEGESQSFVA